MQPKPATRFPRRAIIFGLLFIGMICMSGSLNSMGFAITCMANQSRPAITGDSDECPFHNNSRPGEAGYAAEFDWSIELQGYLLSSSCWGLAVGCFLSWLPDRFGCKRIYLACGILTSVINFLCPLSTRNVGLLIALRALIGLGSAFNWTVLMKVAENWAPMKEIGLVLGVTPAGIIAGPFVNVIVAGGICSTIGWRYIFYFWGTMSGIWCVTWFYLFTDDPHESIFAVSEEELKWIQKGKTGRHRTKKRAIPWLAMLKSPQVWLISFAGFCSGIYLYFMFGFIPTYFKTVLRLPSVYNGAISALPLLMSIVGRFTSGIIADKLTLSKTTSAKVFSFIALILPSVFLVGLSFLGCTQISLAATLIALASLFSCCSAVGFMRAIVYMAPAYVSSVTMFNQIATAFAGVLLPIIMPLFLTSYALTRWRLAFYFIASLMTICGFLYTIFGSAKQQIWGEEPEMIDLREVVPLAHKTSLVNGIA